MEATGKHAAGRAGQASLYADTKTKQRGAEALRVKKKDSSSGRKAPLWVRMTRGAAILLAIVVVAVGVAAVLLKDESSAYAAQANTSQPVQTGSPANGGGWTPVDVRQAAADYANQLRQTEEQTCYTIGMEDAEKIPAIHSRLMELGYMEADEPSATYSEMTAQAVKLFERKNGFEMDGVLTQYEYDLLMSDEAAKYSVSLGDEGTDVSELQRRLVELGYLQDVTGEFGIYTQKAVKAFQKANNLSADGTIGQETREMLYSDEAKAKALSYGDTAEILKTYQERLKKLNYYNGAINGIFNSELRDAVKAFQNKNGLIADGAIGATTAELLMSDEAQPSSYSLGDSGDMVKKIQQRLVELKYMTGATGYFGENTETAVKRFQSANGLKADGKIGEKTLEVLFSDGAKKYTKPSTGGNTGGNTGGGSTGGNTGGSSTGGNTGGNTGGSNGGNTGGGNTGGNTGGSSNGGNTGGGSTGGNTKPSGNEATDSADSSKVAKFIEVAKSKLGCKYILGAKGPDTFDCSGFVYWCLKQVGVNQAYMTSAGWKATTKYPIITKMSDLEKGDVISYEGHVGIYIGGNQMIDASSSEGKIRITNIYSVAYWKNHFIKGCRIF